MPKERVFKEGKMAKFTFDELSDDLKEKLRNINQRGSAIVQFLNSADDNGTMCICDIPDEEIPEAHKRAASVTLKPPSTIDDDSKPGEFIYLPKGCVDRYLKKQEKK